MVRDQSLSWTLPFWLKPMIPFNIMTPTFAVLASRVEEVAHNGNAFRRWDAYTAFANADVEIKTASPLARCLSPAKKESAETLNNIAQMMRQVCTLTEDLLRPVLRKPEDIDAVGSVICEEMGKAGLVPKKQGAFSKDLNKTLVRANENSFHKAMRTMADTQVADLAAVRAARALAERNLESARRLRGIAINPKDDMCQLQLRMTYRRALRRLELIVKE